MKVVVYGANGFQGKLVLAELSRRGIAPILAGRSDVRLKEAATLAGVPGAEVRRADTDDPAALAAAFGDADVVLNCAGPFAPSGAKVIRAALDSGSNYVDTCGEQPHIQHVHRDFDDAARLAGVTVVPATTDGGVPGDLLAQLLAERLGPLESITAAHRIVSDQMSRGSLRTLAGIAGSIRDEGLAYRDGDWRLGSDSASAPFTFPGESEPTRMLEFPLQEIVSVPRHVDVRTVTGLLEESIGGFFANPLPPDVIEALPEGPDGEQRRTNHWIIVLDAVAADGGRARGFARGPDTYETTAVIAVESAVRLAAGGAVTGVLAPAQAFPAAEFLDSLGAQGISWVIE